MKQLFIVANWKSHKTKNDVKEWLQTCKIEAVNTKKEVIVCPPFTLLSEFISYSKENASSIKIGAQDISPFDEGPYTGEVNSKQVKEFADYVIIGHSERRKYFGESDEIISQKLSQALKAALTPILCISHTQQILHLQKYLQEVTIIIAYEPEFAIGSGSPDTPENAEAVAKEIKQILPHALVLYGGSVSAENIGEFTQMSHINGVLVGNKSLDPQEFSLIISHA